MRFWDEMNSKWGFSDGDAIPVEARQCRTVYLRVMNKLLEKHHSRYRAVAYNRPGVHNAILWLRVPVTVFDKISAENRLSGELTSEELALVPDRAVPADEAWLAAYQEAEDLDADELIETTVTVDEAGLQEILAGI